MKKEIKKLYEQGYSYGEISKELGITKELVKYYCSSPIEKQKITRGENLKEKYKDIIVDLLPNVTNIHQICRAIGWRGTNTRYAMINKVIEENNLDTSHFEQWPGKRGEKRIPLTKEDIFCNPTKMKNKAKIKDKIFKFELKSYQCEKCGLSEWQGEKIPLEVHHINGNNQDNRIENLQLLCPNCHALTDNYCGKNIKK